MTVEEEKEETFFGPFKRMTEEEFEIATKELDKDSKVYKAIVATRNS